MQGVAIDFYGGYKTRINFTKRVEGKALQEQKYLTNVATLHGTDPIFPLRGTKLLDSAIGGALVAVTGLTDAFAAVDTLYFCNYEESPAMYNSPDNIQYFSLSPSAYNDSINSIGFTANFVFADQTSNSTLISVANNA